MTEKNKNLIRPANGMCVDTCPSWGMPTPGASRGRCAAVDRVRGLFGFGEVDGFSPPGGDCPFAVLRDLLGVNELLVFMAANGLSTGVRNDGQCHACAKYPMGKCAPPRAGLCPMFEPVVASVPLPSDPPPHEPDLSPADPAVPPYAKEQWERIVARARENSYNRMFHPQPQPPDVVAAQRTAELYSQSNILALAQASKMAAESEAMRRRANALAHVRLSLSNILSSHHDLGSWKHQVFNEEDCTCPRCKLGRLLDYIDASLKGPA
jgi:hypothetical protein